jgi:hypothetical protein
MPNTEGDSGDAIARELVGAAAPVAKYKLVPARP